MKEHEFINGQRQKFFLIPLEVLQDSWGSTGELLGTGGDKFQDFREKEKVLGNLQIHLNYVYDPVASEQFYPLIC